MDKIDVTAVITAHAEGVLAGMSYRNIKECVATFEKSGYAAELLIVLDSADSFTCSIFSDAEENKRTRVIYTDFEDQGKARNCAVAEANGEYIAFLDADDLWSNNWLIDAYEMIQAKGDNTILHPEFNWFFAGTASLVIGIDQYDEKFDPSFLRFANYWDALCFAHSQTYRSIPYSDRSVKDGFAYEDWYWNCETVECGFVHQIVPDTIHFKRRRERSQTVEASGTASLPPRSNFHIFEKQA